MHIAKLTRSFDLKTNRFVPEIDMDEFRGPTRRRPDIEDVARSVRELWMLPRGPVANMAELIEENGGILVRCDFETDLIDAMSQRIDGMPVLFFVNMNSPSDRVRYTLAHELGHIVLHTTSVKSDEEMEDDADQFAGAFLLPSDKIKIQRRRFDLRNLANMKGYWKVSMQAIAYRAYRLNLITPYQNKMFWIEMGKLGYRKREPNEPKKEAPALLRRMIAFHQRQLDYSVADFARLLCMEVGEFLTMYNPELNSSPYKEPFTCHRLIDDLAKVCKEAGIRKIGWHVLRHTFATNLAMLGVPLSTVQMLLGHSTISTTMRYAHVAPSTLRAVIDLLNSNIGIKQNFGQPVGNQWQSAVRSKILRIERK